MKKIKILNSLEIDLNLVPGLVDEGELGHAHVKRIDICLHKGLDDIIHFKTLLHELGEAINLGCLSYSINHEDLSIFTDAIAEALIALGVNPRIEI